MYQTTGVRCFLLIALKIQDLIPAFCCRNYDTILVVQPDSKPSRLNPRFGTAIHLYRVIPLVLRGTSGATLLLPFLLMRSRSIHLKSIGQVSAVPGLFNINEPVIFGMPIVMNPTLFIPFVFGPVITSSIAYFVIEFGLVSAAVTIVPWTTPGPIGAAWAANWALEAGLLASVLAVVALAIYYPFVKAYEKQLVAQESAASSRDDTANLKPATA